MSRNKLTLIFVVVVLLAGMVYSSASAVKPPFSEEIVVWEISKPVVISEGQTVETREGTLTTGYVIEAKAKAKNNNVVPEGSIVFTFSVFTPLGDMPGQVPGIWYVHGDWVITKKNASIESAKARHSSDKAMGNIKAELAFNPLAQPGNWSGLAWIPMSLAAGQWSRGQGTVTLNGQFEGELLLDLSRLPEIQ